MLIERLNAAHIENHTKMQIEKSIENGSICALSLQMMGAIFCGISIRL